MAKTAAAASSYATSGCISPPRIATSSWGGYEQRLAPERNLGGSGESASGDLHLSTAAEDAAVEAWPGGPAPAKKAKRQLDPRTEFKLAFKRPVQKVDPQNPCAIILQGNPPTVEIQRPPENDADRAELQAAYDYVNSFA